MSEPIVSIIVPTLHRTASLAACLDSIEATVGVPYEVIGVTVADDEPAAVLFEERGARSIVQPERRGFVAAVNAGLGAARGTYLTTINDDCVLLPHAIENAIRFLEAPAHRHVGLAAFFNDTPVRRNVFAQIMVEGTWYFVCHVRGLCYANFGLARRTLYEQLDYYDERYFMYGADPDFSLKVWHDAGLAVAPCPGALVHHAELEDERARTERAGQVEDNRRLFEKWSLGAPRASTGVERAVATGQAP